MMAGTLTSATAAPNPALGFLARQIQRRQLRIVDGAATMQRRCVRVRAIAREAFPQIGEPSVSPVLLDQARKANPPAPLAAMTRDVEQVELTLQLFEDDRSAVAHSRNPKPASAGTISISHCFSTSRRVCGSPPSPPAYPVGLSLHDLICISPLHAHKLPSLSRRTPGTGSGVRGPLISIVGGSRNPCRNELGGTSSSWLQARHDTRT